MAETIIAHFSFSEGLYIIMTNPKGGRDYEKKKELLCVSHK